VRGYFVRWSWNGSKPEVKVLRTVTNITQDWRPTK
jgi:hypothetical protein